VVKKIWFNKKTHPNEHRNAYWLSMKCELASDQSSVSLWLVQPIKLSSAAGRCARRGCALVRQLATSNCNSSLRQHKVTVQMSIFHVTKYTYKTEEQVTERISIHTAEEDPGTWHSLPGIPEPRSRGTLYTAHCQSIRHNSENFSHQLSVAPMPQRWIRRCNTVTAVRIRQFHIFYWKPHL